jgi:4-hydroxy-tetrahydrodipicolinate reductase
MLRIAVTGAVGRMGRTLIESIHATDDLMLGAAIERADCPLLGADAGEVIGVGRLDVPVVADIQGVIGSFDVLVDFSIPAATLQKVDSCVRAGKAMVIGTTGFDASGLDRIHAAAKQIPVLMSPNMSVGVNLVFRLIEIAARAMGNSADIEVIEAHHRNKIDAPSGTAIRMGEILAGATGRSLGDVAVYGRQGVTGVRDRKTIGFETIRAGDIVGDHTVMFAAAGERIEITHRAHTRSNFAEGALRAARFLSTASPGMHAMKDVLGL